MCNGNNTETRLSFCCFGRDKMLLPLPTTVFCNQWQHTPTQKLLWWRSIVKFFYNFKECNHEMFSSIWYLIQFPSCRNFSRFLLCCKICSSKNYQPLRVFSSFHACDKYFNCSVNTITDKCIKETFPSFLTHHLAFIHSVTRACRVLKQHKKWSPDRNKIFVSVNFCFRHVYVLQWWLFVKRRRAFLLQVGILTGRWCDEYRSGGG